MNTNGEFFRSFASSFIAANGVDSSNVWTMGYSGGAEFITYELTDHNTAWRNGGGSIMVAGGDSDGSVDADATTKACLCTGGLARMTPPVTPIPSPGAHEAQSSPATTHTWALASPTLA